MRFTVLSSKALSRYICDKKHQPSLVNYMPTTRQWEIQNYVSEDSTLFLPRLFKRSNDGPSN